ncbi:uncharacterized protein LOC135146465 [Zophobas morio]|uniref:uncharacterized protein LOC135146465 n=1 Tax=Zophobas morio TaxID=2755281 RepID=UPI003083A55D
MELSSSDIRFTKRLVSAVNKNYKEGEYVWTGSDDWIRQEFRDYTVRLLYTILSGLFSGEKGKVYEEFNSQYVGAFKETKCFDTWIGRINPHRILSSPPPPLSSEHFEIDDVSLSNKTFRYLKEELKTLDTAADKLGQKFTKVWRTYFSSDKQKIKDDECGTKHFNSGKEPFLRPLRRSASLKCEKGYYVQLKPKTLASLSESLNYMGFS